VGKKYTPIGLTADQISRRNVLVTRLRHEYLELAAAVEALSVPLERYNAAVADAAEFAGEVEASVDAAISERSDTWQGSGACDPANDFMAVWVDAAVDLIPLHLDVEDYSERLLRLPEQPGK
jgi:hypothetical protein